MIFLTSNGLSNRFLLRQAGKYIDSGKAALVVTADHEYKEKNYHVKRLTRELQVLGLCVDCFDFDTQSPSELMRYDVVEIMGGQSLLPPEFHKGPSFFRCLKGICRKQVLDRVQCRVCCSYAESEIDRSLYP